MSDKARVTIVGGGLAGALMAVYMGRRGHPVRVYERRPDIRGAEVVRGRSINLAISTRGLDALARVGLEKRILEMAVPMRGRMMHAIDGSLSFQPYGKDDSEVINSVSRAELNRVLLEEAARLDGVELFFEQACVEVDHDTATATFEHERTGERTVVEADLVFGTDGAFSVVRRRLLRHDRFSYSQDYLAHGYLELNIPPLGSGGFRIEKNALHIWPRHQFMMIALPNIDGSFTVTLFWPLEGRHAFENLKDAQSVRDYFARWFPDAVPHLPSLVEDYLARPASSLVTVRCYPWSYRDKVTLLGDACHAVVPFYGQGMNAAFEDCAILDECIAKHEPDWTRVLDEYQKLRKPNVDALADLAIENFLEMRDRVASPVFLIQKQLTRLAQKLLPGFLPLYSLITFSRVPYAEARERARRRVRRGKIALSVVGILLLILLTRWIWP